ncbi:glycine rich protein [Candidatus Termititenax persephonae]|uniref:receptor protein-tyrosine kinase n=1 Tax=Candidatus Termititenax persephonae TaxID=2218525 RepID=A0A388TI62_9BACT|nr:glycine rich protein [Candidatus Termititenax persephonae]
MARNSYSDSYEGITAGNRVKASDINNALAKMQNVSDKLTSAATNADSYTSFTDNSADHNKYPSAKLLHMVKGHLDSLIAPKANDNETAHLTGNENIDGQKHFAVAPTVPAKHYIPANANDMTVPATQAQVLAVGKVVQNVTYKISSYYSAVMDSTVYYPSCNAVRGEIDAIEDKAFTLSPSNPPPFQPSPFWVYCYTGDVQTFIAPKDGTYRLEVLGAPGGGSEGGMGGYAKGNIGLTAGATLYIYVGGTTGWNGGATDIRLGGTELTNRIIVAGGDGVDNGYIGGVDNGSMQQAVRTCDDGIAQITLLSELWVSASLTSTQITWYDAVRKCIEQTHAASDVPDSVKADMNARGYTANASNEDCVAYQDTYALGRKKVYRLLTSAEWVKCRYADMLNTYAKYYYEWVSDVHSSTGTRRIRSYDNPNDFWATTNPTYDKNSAYFSYGIGFRLARLA